MSNSHSSTNFDEFFSENNFYSAPTNDSSNHINKLRSSIQIPNSISSRSIKDGLRQDNEVLTLRLPTFTSRTSMIKSSPSLRALESILNEKSKNWTPGTIAEQVTEEEEEEEEDEEKNDGEEQSLDDDENALNQLDALDIRNKYSPQRKAAPVSFKNPNETLETVNSMQTFETADEAIEYDNGITNRSSNKRASKTSHMTKSSISTISGSGYSTDDTPILGQPPTFQNFTQHNVESPQLKVIETGVQQRLGSKDDTLINDTTESPTNDISEETVSVDLPQFTPHNSSHYAAKERNEKTQNKFKSNFSNTTNNSNLDTRDKKLDNLSSNSQATVETLSIQSGGRPKKHQHHHHEFNTRTSQNFKKSAFAPLSKPAIPAQNNNPEKKFSAPRYDDTIINLGTKSSTSEPQDFDPDMNYEPYKKSKLNSKKSNKGDSKPTSMLSVLTPNQENLQKGGGKKSNISNEEAAPSKNKAQSPMPTTPQRSPHLRSNSSFSLNFAKKSSRDEGKPQLLHKRSSTMDDLNKASRSNMRVNDAPTEKKKFSFRTLFKSKSKSHELNKSLEPIDTRAQQVTGKSYSTTNIPLHRLEDSPTTKHQNRTDLLLPPLTKTKSNISIMSVFKKNKSSDQLYSMGKAKESNTEEPKEEVSAKESANESSTPKEKHVDDFDGSPILLDERFTTKPPSKAAATPGSINFIREVSDNNVALTTAERSSESSDVDQDEFEDADEDVRERDEDAEEATKKEQEEEEDEEEEEEDEDDDDRLSFDPSADEKFDVYDSKNLQANPPVQRVSNHQQGEEILLIPPLIQDTQFGSPFKVDYESSPDIKRPARILETAPSACNSAFANTDDAKPFSASLSPSASPVPKRYPSRKEDKNYQLLGEALFPRSLSAHEVESIVSLERSRSLKSIKSNKRSSFVNYDGSDDNIVHYDGPTSSPHNSGGITRSGSILKNSASKPSNLSKEIEPSSIDANILDDDYDEEAVPNSSSVYSQPSGASFIKSQFQSSPRSDDQCLQFNLTEGSDLHEFMEFSDFIDVDNLTFNYSPSAVTGSASASPRPDINEPKFDVNERIRAEATTDTEKGQLSSKEKMVDPPDIRFDDDDGEEAEQNGAVLSQLRSPPTLRIDTVDFPNSTASHNSPVPLIVESRTPSPSPLSMNTTESPKTSVEVVDGFEKLGGKVNRDTLAANDDTTLDDSENDRDYGNTVVDSDQHLKEVNPQCSNNVAEERDSDDNATEVISNSPILDSAYRTTKKSKSSNNNRPISMSFKGLNKPSFSGKIAQHDLRSSDSHQSFTISFNDDLSSVGGGFGTSSDDEEEEDDEEEVQEDMGQVPTIRGDEGLSLINNQPNQEYSEYEKENLVPTSKEAQVGVNSRKQQQQQQQRNTQPDSYEYNDQSQNKTPPSKSRSVFGKESNYQNNSVESSNGSYSPDFRIPLPPPPFGTKFSHNKIPSISDQSSTSSSPRSFTSMLSRWKRSNNSNNNNNNNNNNNTSNGNHGSVNILAPRVAPPPPVPTKQSGVRFSSRIILYDTYNDEEYDRHPDTATCNQLTPLLAQQIKEEMNMIKSEMEVHVESRCYTQFF